MTTHQPLAHFEFEYGDAQRIANAGAGTERLLFGALPADVFQALLDGEGPAWLAIQELREWDPAEGSFVARHPGGGTPQGACMFRGDLISRVWRVEAPDESETQAPPRRVRASPRLLVELDGFFGTEISEPRILTEKVHGRELVNVDLAIADLVEKRGSDHRVLGFSADRYGLEATLSATVTDRHDFNPVRVGPPEWARLAVGPDEHRDCLEKGVHLIDLDVGKVAIAICKEQVALDDKRTIEVLALEDDAARDTLEYLREAMVQRNTWRGRTITLQDAGSSFTVEFCSVEVPERDEIVLAPDVLELVERNALAVHRHRDRLLAAGRHLRRGVLLHGSPGTGKTLTTRYIVGNLPEHTVILLTGQAIGFLKEAFRLACLLAPSAIVIEDVDLIAKERTENACAAMLHGLLDMMDGLGPRVEVLFILTTNQPELLEPALAARPGRIDQAIEFPVPREQERRELFELYGRGMQLAFDIDTFVERTDGASGAFVKELLRRALLHACDHDDEEVQEAHMERALHELVESGGILTRTLVGFHRPGATT